MAMTLVVPMSIQPAVMSSKETVVKTQVLFAFFDAGETNALLPVIEQLEKEGKDYRILAMGTAEGIVRTRGFSKHLITLSDLSIPEQVDAYWDRNNSLSAESLAKVTQRIRPETVVVGVSCAIFGDMIKAYSKTPEVNLFAYRDNYNHGNSECFVTAAKVQACIPAKRKGCKAAVLFPLAESMEAFSKESYERITVGKPPLEQLKQAVDGIKADEIRSRLGLRGFKGRVITWIGGYDEPGKDDYKKAFQVFKRCMEQYSKDQYRVWVCLHPKEVAKGGKLEEEEIAKDERFAILPTKEKAPTMAELIGSSDVIATFGSTVGFDAVTCGRKVIYINRNDFLEIHRGFAASAFNPEEFQKGLSALESNFGQGKKLQMPTKSVELIRAAIGI